MIALVEQNREAIAELCRTYGVYKLDLFGSAATGAFQPEKSDLDFVVNFWNRGPGYPSRYLELAESLERLLGRGVDLVTERSIQNPYFRTMVESQREGVFEDPDREAAARRADRE
ncbi:MAG: nucleotidyltransferase family protein [Thermomicrobiales bacterium]